jgi:hypothetical protein
MLPVIGGEVNYRQAGVLDPVPRITGCIAITALSLKVTEPSNRPVHRNRVANLNVALASGDVTVLDCPLPLRIIELNKAGRLTLTVASPMFPVTSRL